MFLFWRVLLAEFIAEMGDKTQLMLIGLISKYKLRDIVFGTAAAILILNGIAVLAGGLVGALIPEWVIKLIAGVVFLLFAVTSLRKDSEDEEETKENAISFAPFAVFLIFFVAELGDKTQLTAIAFGASEGLAAGLIVWLACSIGLFAADMIGMLVGYLLKKRLPARALSILAAVIFAVYGVFLLREGVLLRI